MILGLLSGLDRQRQVLPPAIVRALEAFEKQGLATKPTGRYEIEGDRIFCLIQDAKPRALADCFSEAHHCHADIQIPIGATERFGFSLPQAGLLPCDDQLESRDLAFYPTPANEFFMDVEPGAFVVFLPTELHRPCVLIGEAGGNPGEFRKAVIKVHADLLGLSPENDKNLRGA